MTEQTRKAKRRLSNISFENDGAHIALVHKEQGGAASGYSTLIMKATNKYSPEFIQKATQVQVTLTFEEFLRKFFNMWYDEAEILATMLGMEDDDDEDGYQDYVERQVASFQILKSAYESENKVDFLSNLSEQDYLSVLETQEKIEKALAASPTIEPSEDKPKVQGVGKQPESKTVNKQNKQKAGKAVPKEDNNMSGTPETIEKAQYDAKEVELQKALEEIQKAKQEIEAFKAKEKQAIEKAREAEIKEAVADEVEATKLFKAVKDLEDEAFKDVVGVVKALSAKLDDSDMFHEKGSKEEGVKVAKSAVAAELDRIINKAK